MSPAHFVLKKVSRGYLILRLCIQRIIGQIQRFIAVSKYLTKWERGIALWPVLIYGLYKQMPEKEIIQFATAAAFGKFFERGDAT